MKGYKPREFIKLLKDQGWCEKGRSGDHVTYCKPGALRIITIPVVCTEISRPMARRLLKIAGE